MKKKSVLGQDPLGWMKAGREKNTSPPESKEEKNDNGSHMQEKPKPQQTQPEKNKNVQDDSDKKQTERVFNVITGSSEQPKPKVVIGRLYEEVSKRAEENTQKNNTTTPVAERKDISQPAQGYEALQRGKDTQSKLKNGYKTRGSSQFTTYLIIAYTALLLILGYFVYSDFSKRTDRLEARIYAIERALHLR